MDIYTYTINILKLLQQNNKNRYKRRKNIKYNSESWEPQVIVTLNSTVVQGVWKLPLQTSRACRVD